MYKYRIIDCASPLSPADLDDFERFAGAKLPEELRSHYLAFNGGRVEDERYSFIRQDAAPGEVNGFSLSELFPIKYTSPVLTTRLEDAYGEYVLKQKVVPAGFLPIGYDIGGWPLCYRLADGVIFSLQRETVDDDGNEALVVVCNSLAALIDGMLTIEEFEDAL